MVEPNQRRVREFHIAFGQPAPKKFTPLRDEGLKLRVKLILEEALEFCSAAGYYIEINHPDDNFATSIDDVDLVCMDGIEPDDVEMIDALCDLNYVADGTAVAMGLDLEPFSHEIHRSNMSKLGADGRPRVREDGKIQKSDLYSPPDVARVLDVVRALEVASCGK